MRTKMNVLALATAVCALLFAPAAWAEDADAQLVRELEQRLLAAEDKLQDSETTIQAQRDLLKTQAAPAVGQGSSLDKFFSSLEVGGHVTGSYTYSFENPSQTTGGAIRSQPLCQFNCNHNTFQFDAAKLELGKATDGPGTAGFQLDLLFGANNKILGATTATANDTGVYVQEAYAAYNFNGVDLKFGKFETILGYEVLDSPANPHVSHGILYTFAIPLVHTGLLASGDFNENLGWALGITNGFNNVTDTNENKGALGSLRFKSGQLATSLNAYYGADVADSDFPYTTSPLAPNASVDNQNSDDQLILDLVATFDVNDTTQVWLNADWGEQNRLVNTAGRFNDVTWWGLAAGGKLQVNDKLSFALRGEYFNDENGYRLTTPLSGPGAAFLSTAQPRDAEAYSLTGTMGYALTENLMTRFELRWDRLDVSTALDKVIPSGTAGSSFEDEGVTGYIEVSYLFD